MNTNFFETAGLCFSVSSEIDFDFGAAGKFFYSKKKNPVFSYEIKAENPSVGGKTVYKGDIFSVCEEGDSVARRFRNIDGDFVLSYNKNNPKRLILSGNENILKQQEKSLVTGYFALEVPLIYNDAFILHSSLVKIDGCSVAFSGVSGAGKSTQASLWEKFKGAKIISGDRSCIKVSENGISAYGTFYSGSSDIYCNDGAPLNAIVFISHSKENSLVRLSKSKSFMLLYEQALNNPWDKAYVERLISLIEKTAASTPVYLLQCRPDEDAVNLLYNELSE